MYETWTEVDGVPVVWAPGDGPLRAALSFRTGTADETAPIRGISHLTEHLVLHGLHEHRFDHNGFVDLTRTVFHCDGSPEEVVRFLGHVCGRLSGGLPTERLEVERRVLRAEEAERGRSAGEVLMAKRFGVRQYGLCDAPELGVDWLDERTLAWWTGHRYGRANAILWLTGPPPEGLRLPLGDAPHHLPPPVQPLPRATPAWFVREGDDVVALSALLPAAEAGRAASVYLLEELNRRLRFEAGLTYGVKGDVRRLDGATYHLVVSAGVPEKHARLRDELVATIERLATEGITEETARPFLLRVSERETQAHDVLDLLAIEHLCGLPRRTVAEAEAAVRDVDPASMTAAFRAIANSAIYLLPKGLDLPSGRYTMLPRWSTVQVAGDLWRPVPLADGTSYEQSLVIGPDGVTMTVADGTVTVRWADAVAVLWWRDGARVVVGADGFQVAVMPDEWFDGAGAVARIDALAPRDRYVPRGEGDPERQGRALAIAEAVAAGARPPTPAAATPTIPGGLPIKPWHWWVLVALGALMALRLVTVAFHDPAGPESLRVVDWPGLLIGLAVAGATAWGATRLLRRQD
ncbi:MAG TPA: hypothetical protein VGX28_03425 [Frankiaceae bacterium]|nr:hypothetical protein [Frankiaceae bacterium]